MRKQSEVTCGIRIGDFAYFKESTRTRLRSLLRISPDCPLEEYAKAIPLREMQLYVSEEGLRASPRMAEVYLFRGRPAEKCVVTRFEPLALDLIHNKRRR